MRHMINVIVLLTLLLSSVTSFAQTNEATQDLHAAILDRQLTPAIVKALKARGADFNLPFVDGRLPLDVAIENNVSHSTLRALMAAGAMISTRTDISQFREGFRAHFTRLAPAVEAATAAQAALGFPPLPSAALAWFMQQAPQTQLPGNAPMETGPTTVSAAAAAAYFPTLPADAVACPIDRAQTHAPATAPLRVVQPQNPPALLSAALGAPRSLSQFRFPYDANSRSASQ